MHIDLKLCRYEAPTHPPVVEYLPVQASAMQGTYAYIQEKRARTPTEYRRVSMPTQGRLPLSIEGKQTTERTQRLDDVTSHIIEYM